MTFSFLNRPAIQCFVSDLHIMFMLCIYCDHICSCSSVTIHCVNRCVYFTDSPLLTDTILLSKMAPLITSFFNSPSAARHFRMHCTAILAFKTLCFPSAKSTMINSCRFQVSPRKLFLLLVLISTVYVGPDLVNLFILGP